MNTVTIGGNAVVIPEGCVVRVNHYHPNNASKEILKRSKYLTVARLLDEEGFPIAVASARCSKNDCPNRKVGLRIALGRLNKLTQEIV